MVIHVIMTFNHCAMREIESNCICIVNGEIFSHAQSYVFETQLSSKYTLEFRTSPAKSIRNC